jgi:nitroreductase
MGTFSEDINHDLRVVFVLVLKALKTRRSVRKYKSDNIPENVLMEILDCTRLTPSGHNKQPWQFVIIKDKDTRQKISELARYGRFIKEAPVCLAVFCSPVADTCKEDTFAFYMFDVVEFQ